MSKNSIKTALSLLAVIAVAAMIFGFSAQSGEESGGLSDEVARILLGVFESGFNELSPGDQMRRVHEIGLYVRKGAHFCEYALLAVALVNYLCRLGSSRIRRAVGLVAWSAASLYACTDELHQMFVSDRSAALVDVCIDAAGALAGVLFALLILRLARKRRGATSPDRM